LLILHVLGWSKLPDLDWWSQKFPRMDILARKKISMLDRTLTTPIIYITTNLTKDLNQNTVTLKLEIQIFESYLTHDA